MKYYIKLADDNKTICGVAFDKEDGTIEIELEKEIDDIAFGGYQYINGKIIENVEKHNEYICRKKIDELKEKLFETDYKAIKYAEGLIDEEEYLPVKKIRQSYRLEINKLEDELKSLEG